MKLEEARTTGQAAEISHPFTLAELVASVQKTVKCHMILKPSRQRLTTKRRNMGIEKRNSQTPSGPTHLGIVRVIGMFTAFLPILLGVRAPA